MSVGTITGLSYVPFCSLAELRFMGAKGAGCRSTATSGLIFTLSTTGKEIYK